MINIAVCDDDIQITGQLDLLLRKVAKQNFAEIEIEVFFDGKTLADAVEQGHCYDIILLDIEMEKEDGISAAKRIRIHDKKALIIYITSHENHMQESFTVRPFRYLLKPVSEKEFELCFRDAYEEIISEDAYFRYSSQRIQYKIPIRDIIYFESEKRKILIVTEKGIFTTYGKMDVIEKSLEQSRNSFLRVHQSYLVNYKHIEGLSYDFVLMDNGKRISISENRRKQISEQYCAMEDTFYAGE